MTRIDIEVLHRKENVAVSMATVGRPLFFGGGGVRANLSKARSVSTALCSYEKVKSCYFPRCFIKLRLSSQNKTSIVFSQFEHYLCHLPT